MSLKCVYICIGCSLRYIGKQYMYDRTREFAMFIVKVCPTLRGRLFDSAPQSCIIYQPVCYDAANWDS